MDLTALTPEDVAGFLGREGDTALVSRAALHLPVVTEFVRGYTRGEGFDPATGAPGADLGAVILTCCARLVTNPDQVANTTLGPSSVSYPRFVGAFTLAELVVLNGHRRRAA